MVERIPLDRTLNCCSCWLDCSVPYFAITNHGGWFDRIDLHRRSNAICSGSWPDVGFDGERTANVALEPIDAHRIE